MTQQGSDHRAPEVPLGVIRLAIGLFQGLAVYGLHRAWDLKVWPAREPGLFWALALLAIMVPLLVLGSLGQLRRVTLIVCTLAGSAMLTALALYGVWRQVEGPGPTTLPVQVWLAAAGALFIGHHLLAAADQERRWIATYRFYFDTAWKSGIQLALAVAFVGVFWAVLHLGAALFAVIKITAFREVIAKDWFAIPATAVVFAGAVQLTDVRVALTRGIRTVALTLLSWLMPLMALIAGAFLAALPFTGLKLLWATHSATSILLGAAAALIVLINAAYQDGDADRRPNVVLRWAGRLATLVLVPMVGLAAYGLFLRVGQYGWTPDRIIASACALVAAGHAIGYVIAAVMPGPWMKRLELTNVAMAFVSMAVIIALFTPIADPARISVADQVRRLESGRISPDAFDFEFLRSKAGRFGAAALERLKTVKSGRYAVAIALSAHAPPLATPDGAMVSKAPMLAADIKVFPKGKTLPDSFKRQDWSRNGVSGGPCFDSAEPCEALRIDLDGDGADEILLANDYSARVYILAGQGEWDAIGAIPIPNEQTRLALQEGHFQLVKPRWQDVVVGGRRMRLELDVNGLGGQE